jgi:hypothetical protein
MSALDFPQNPTVGQTYDNWKWDGAKWPRISDATVAGVSAFNGRAGAVTLTSADITGAHGALLASPVFTGFPSVPTQSLGDNSGHIASTAFVASAIAAAPVVASFNGRVGAVTLQAADLTAVGGASLASPAFTGSPTAPTPTPGDNSTKLATTAFVTTSFAPLNSPVFTGAPTAPTVAAGDNSTKIATTAWVQSQIASGYNRLINGDMLIDQRNNGAIGTAAGYTVDRWSYVATQTSKGTWQRQNNSLSGFPYCLSFKSLSAYSLLATDYFIFVQGIEADTIGDFAWGTASAQPVTLSFWANSSAAGTYSGSIKNYASTRSYPFYYTLPANTWTKVVMTIPGDTAGTWVMSGNGGAAYVIFDLGSGSNFRGPAGAWASGSYNGVTGAVSTVAVNGATFQVTGVKLETGSVATPFNRQTVAKSLLDCQRYYQVITGLVATTYALNATNNFWDPLFYLATMRVAPSIVLSNIGYGNSSGLSAGNVTPFGCWVTALVTLGNSPATANYTANLSAEL